MTAHVPDYGFASAAPSHTARFLLPAIRAFLPPQKPLRILDVGCGNGFLVSQYAQLGHHAIGVDASTSGIAHARAAHPNLRFEQLEIGPATDLLSALNEPPFDVVTSVEVVEHLYDPRSWARACYSTLKPGGRLICTTPYHGYLKNLAIALTGKFDKHVSPLWDGGHIKFFSRKTLSALLTEAGFTNLQFCGAGRAPYLWMGMVMAADRPVQDATS